MTSTQIYIDTMDKLLQNPSNFAPFIVKRLVEGSDVHFKVYAQDTLQPILILVVRPDQLVIEWVTMAVKRLEGEPMDILPRIPLIPINTTGLISDMLYYIRTNLLTALHSGGNDAVSD